MSTDYQYQKRILYYAARVDDQKIEGIKSQNFSHVVGKTWEIAFLIHQHGYLLRGIYDHEDGNRYYVSEISWEDFDLLNAFGVPCTTEFPAHYPTSGDP
jgi:hypothetical protein